MKKKRKKKTGKKRSDKRPLSFLKKMRNKMEKNIVKLDRLIANPGSRPA